MLLWSKSKLSKWPFSLAAEIKGKVSSLDPPDVHADSGVLEDCLGGIIFNDFQALPYLQAEHLQMYSSQKENAVISKASHSL